EGAAPLEEFRKRTLTDATRAKAQALVKKLGDESFTVRESAQSDLKAMGVAVIPLLRQGSRQSDPEISMRCKKCLDELEKDKALPLSPVAIGIVALRKPAGAGEVLLAYLPSAEDDTLAAEVQSALNVVTFHAGKPDPAVFKALNDRDAMRRGAAAEALS